MTVTLPVVPGPGHEEIVPESDLILGWFLLVLALDSLAVEKSGTYWA